MTLPNTAQNFPWKWTSLVGAAGLSLLGFGAARYPWVHSHAGLAAGSGVLVVLALWWMKPKNAARQPGLGASSGRIGLGLAFIALGAFAAWAVIGVLGVWGYASALKEVDKAGLHAALPPNDPMELSERNGKVILSSLDNETFWHAWGAGEGKSDLRLQTAFRDARAALRSGDGFEKACAKLAAYRKLWVPALQAVDKAQAAPMFSWNIRYDVPYFQIEIPKFAYLLSVTRSLCAEAMVLDAQGKFKESRQRLLQALWISKKMQENPTLISAMIAVAEENLATDTSLMLVRRGQGGEFIAALEGDSAELAVKKALAFEFLMNPQGMQKMAGASAFSGITGEGKAGIQGQVLGFAYTPWINFDAAGWLRDGIALSQSMSLPPLKCTERMEAILNDIATNGWILESMATPRFSDMLLKGVFCSARRGLARTAQAAVSFKRTKGRWPASAAELGNPSYAVDPIRGGFFSMRQEKGHLIISFDGAKDVPAGHRSDTDADISVRL